MTDVLGELRNRGLLAQTTDEAALAAALAEGSITFYIGFDPTAPSLHMGNLVQLIVARHLQRAGHRPLALVGGATGLIGDPRMTGERTLNPVEVVQGWQERIGEQISRFLDFDGENGATLVNNYDWTSQLSAIDFLRDIGKHFSVNQMLSREAVAARLDSESGISFTEFAYQILQGNDYLELHRRHGATLQTGGSDQWGNLVSGVGLIRKVEQTTVHALSTPLVTKADGTKFGKTESGTVWLDPEMTSPYAFHQFWLNAADADAVKYLRIFSPRSLEEIEQIAAEFEASPHTRLAQKTLADDVTAFVHGTEATEQAKDAAAALFGRGELAALDAQTLVQAARELPHAEITADQLRGMSLVDALVESGILASKGAARRAIREGGAYVNNVQQADEDLVLGAADLLGERVVFLRRGKKTLGALIVAG